MSELPTLTERARQGDPQAITLLLHQSEPDLKRFAARVCRNTADADDAVAHAMATLALKLEGFRGLSKLSTWLFTIIRHECLKYERLGRRFLFGIEESVEGNERTPEESLSREQMLDFVVNAVRELRPELREVFVLRELEQLSTEATAERLGISESNVKVRFHRARAELRETLAHLR
jgi:RNA polymerase sigma-70 factor (ECF subfamily)